jgi:hypothetical protein
VFNTSDTDSNETLQETVGYPSSLTLVSTTQPVGVSTRSYLEGLVQIGENYDANGSPSVYEAQVPTSLSTSREDSRRAPAIGGHVDIYCTANMEEGLPLCLTCFRLRPPARSGERRNQSIGLVAALFNLLSPFAWQFGRRLFR